jgi:ubiquitin-protein ligase
MQWYRNNQRLFREERAALAEACPLMMLSIVGPGFRINPVAVTKTECAVAQGSYGLCDPNNQDNIEYGIVMGLPSNYPKSPPVMFCNDPKLPIDVIDRHILENGQACLEVQTEIKRRWPPGSNLIDFITNLVEPFLAWQVYYDAFGKAPEWGDRSHGVEGILEYYAELLGRRVDKTTIKFMKLLARKKHPKGHEICPCGSGKKLRHCHHMLLHELRDKIPRLDAARDLGTVLSTQRHAIKKNITWRIENIRRLLLSIRT